MENKETIFTKLKNHIEAFDFISRKLASPLCKKFNHFSKPTFIDDKALKKLKLKMEAIRATLIKADALAMNDVQDRLWLRELRNLECCAEDVVEKLQFESMRTTRLEEFKLELLTRKGESRNGELTYLFSSEPSRNLIAKINMISNKYRDIAKDRDALRITDDDATRLLHPNRQTPTSSFPKGKLFGREKDVNEVIKLLVSEDIDNKSIFSTIPLVGMAGVGKTTLAQHLLQKETVKSEFDLMIWVYLSQQSGVVEATRKIVEVITKSECTLTELESLHHEVVSQIKGKKFLLVFDDMWDENPENWSTLTIPLKYGAKGSKILVTTRSSKVSQIMSPKKRYLNRLSDDECWSVCQQRACHSNAFDLSADLVKIGKKIAAKCKGLPLAAEAVGGMLSRSVDPKHWKEVLENPLWLEDGDANPILPVLIVSYEFLPLDRKRCFAYCSLFPKGYRFNKSKLMQLWIAQGFIKDADTKCFNDLVDRGFFQYSPSQYSSSHYRSEGIYIMHDLYHELAEYVSGCEYNRIDNYKVTKLDDMVRHSSLVQQEPHSEEAIQLGSLGCTDLHSFLFVGRTEIKIDEIPIKIDEIHFCLNVPCEIFRNLECLRALDLSNTDIAMLPFSIGNLIHLRYLSLENTRIRCLPDSIGGLLNLFTLNLDSCYFLEELPKAIKLLDNLRHLYLSFKRDCYIWMPSGIGKLTNLQTLPLFVVGSDPDSCGIEELGDLEKLSEELCILGLNNVLNAQFAQQAKINTKPKLQKLTLEWSLAGSTSADSSEESSKVLEILEPNPNLEELHIWGFPGTKYPSWLNYPKFKLVSLDLKDCRNLESLPSLGRLANLKHLYIQSMARLQHIGNDFYGSSDFYQRSVAFPVLETLMFKKMDDWEEWVGGASGDFPCLRFLFLNSCTKLRLLPQLPPSVNLRVTKCPVLNVSVSRPVLEYAQCISSA
ncbi:NBS-LRR-like resistance protein [Rhynchospora pubera]|uniref:NBS-LRR-like resistance protein n=1 Tax=Rhynchospora pubera TaxID=906938 RepID=A0AAV8CSZ6_9POAL|nr:NBS-LRR-like resistance protein [Rhynchospora pubera]